MRLFAAAPPVALPASGEDARPRRVESAPWDRVVAWVVCTLRHRRAHRWFPRYLDGYGACSICGRRWQ
jgi:hypothetical protein